MLPKGQNRIYQETQAALLQEQALLAGIARPRTAFWTSSWPPFAAR